MTRRPTLHFGTHGYTLHYGPDEYALITRDSRGDRFCWHCQKRSCEHTAELHQILFSEDVDNNAA